MKPAKIDVCVCVCVWIEQIIRAIPVKASITLGQFIGYFLITKRLFPYESQIKSSRRSNRVADKIELLSLCLSQCIEAFAGTSHFVTSQSSSTASVIYHTCSRKSEGLGLATSLVELCPVEWVRQWSVAPAGMRRSNKC